MSDRWVVVLAIAACCGAQLERHVPIAVAITIVLVALLTRLAPILCVGVLMLTSTLAAQAWQALDEPVPAVVSGVAVLVKDPEVSRYGALSAEVKVDGRHFQLWARGEQRNVLEPMLAGERVHVEGTTEPLSGMSAPYLRRRHIAAKLQAESVTAVSPGNAFVVLANRVRSLLENGASSLPRDKRALLTGFVFGDDRDQDPRIERQFRDAGLSHLLAVSGQNVAFVLLLVTPLTNCFGLRGRLVIGVSVLIAFGFITRWEPSVIRAEAMAAVVMLGIYLGRPLSIWRVLALATTAVVIADPFLVGSVGFLLSLCACIGMAVFGRPLTRMIPGPRAVAMCAGFSAAAQIGVAPVQLVVFDELPVVAVLANVLAEPMAGVIMTWGLAAGLVAGLIGGAAATVLHVPTYWMIAWVEAVARSASALGLGSWNAASLWCLVALVAIRFWWMLRPGYRHGDDHTAPRLSRQGRRPGIVERGSGAADR